MATSTPQTLKKRLIAKLTIPNGKTIAKLTYNKVQINNARFDRAEVKNIKLETGNTATDWTPAPEDSETAINDVQAALTTERNARTEAQRAEAAERQALATKVSQNTAALTAERTARNDAIRAETVARETQIAKFQVADTRRDNQPPSWYWDNYPKQTAKEFKLLNVLGLPVNGMGLLETNVQWQNASGGKIEQKLTDPNGKVWRRLSDTTHTYANGVYTYTKDAWTAWVADETEAGAQAKADAVRQIAEATQRNLTATQAELTAYKATQARADQAQTTQIQAAQTRLNAAESNISNLQRSTSNAERALSEVQNTLTARLDNLQVGGRNLLRNSNRQHNSAAYGTRYELTTAPSVGDDVVITIWGELGRDRTGIGVYNSHGYSAIANLQKIADGVYRGFGRWKKPMNGTTEVTPNDTHLNVYFYPNTGTTSNIINQIKLERGNVGTDWTPAPEDSDTAANAVQAELNAYKATQANADNAQTAEIQAAKSQIGQNKSAIDGIRSTKAEKSEVASLARSTLQSEWRNDVNNAKNQAAADAQTKANAAKSAAIAEANRLNTATNAQITALSQTVSNQNSAVATRMDGLTSKIDNLNIGGRNLVLKSKQTLRVRDASNAENHMIRFEISQDIDFSSIDELTLSSFMRYKNLTRAGSRWWRIGVEAKVTLNDDSVTYPSAWVVGDVATARNGRYAYSWKVPTGKRIKSIDYAVIRIQNLRSTAEMLVSEPKIEIGNVATDWTPAPDDINNALNASIQTTQTAIAETNGKVQSLYSLKVQAVGNRKAVAGLALGADGRTGDSQMLVMADKFALVQPNTTTIKAPFVVATVNGQTKMALAGDLIADGTILGKHLAASQTISAPNISGGTISGSIIRGVRMEAVDLEAANIIGDVVAARTFTAESDRLICLVSSSRKTARTLVVPPIFAVAEDGQTVVLQIWFDGEKISEKSFSSPSKVVRVNKRVEHLFATPATTISGMVSGTSVSGYIPPAQVSGYIPGTTVSGWVNGGSVSGNIPSTTVSGSTSGVTISGSLNGAEIRGTVPSQTVHLSFDIPIEMPYTLPKTGSIGLNRAIDGRAHTLEVLCLVSGRKTLGPLGDVSGAVCFVI